MALGIFRIFYDSLFLDGPEFLRGVIFRISRTLQLDGFILL